MLLVEDTFFQKEDKSLYFCHGIASASASNRGSWQVLFFHSGLISQGVLLLCPSRISF